MQDVIAHEDIDIQQINKTIDRYFLQRIEESSTVSPYYEQLWRDMHRLIQAGGKRLRPRLVLSSYRAFGGNDLKSILDIAVSQELLHLSLLIHDDIIDRDFIRYGVDNIGAKYFKEYYAQVEDGADRRHYAESAALLAGDLLIAGSYNLIVRAEVGVEMLRAVQEVHGKSIFDVAGGELIDTEAAFRDPRQIDARSIALFKTASYTFVGPLTIGAILAGASDEDVDKLRSYAKSLGIAYQLRDDVIGVFGDEDSIGKSTTGDIREGKHTYMVEEFYLRADEDQKRRFEEHFGNKDLTEAGVQKVKALLVESGALQQTEDAIDAYAREATGMLTQISSGDTTSLYELVEIVTKRSK